GQASFKAKRRLARQHLLEQVGGQLREMMPWIKANQLVDRSKN
ncbi:MAG: ketol-acid reductoisomerase, partial [Pseudomonadota bacterium]|nr:ketol-acid reductoisomerase [Pseudomonadota bacterium]